MMPVSRQPVKPAMEISAFSYQKFVRFTLEQTQSRIDLIPLPLQEKYKCMKAVDQKTMLQTLSFQAPKIRMLRSLTIEGGQSMQVLDFAVFPEPEFDLPIFCANFFTAASMNIIVLDLNPLHDVTVQREYREKYYKSLMPLGQKYVELLPWGDKITSESLRFFSPIVIWTKFTSSQYKHDVLYSAFVDYFKDPGHPILTRLIGDALAKDLVRNFLFNGVATLGSKSFLDYFPEYRCEDGTINKRRSMIGKSFETRPWDASGEYIGNEL
ncbi:phytochromobilin:ferredoxin oxidoreductase, chloroplastic isoform X4 [Magnolia sinica]|uniref:phytochromobilin:ferredoxin oxidoreductase, chloroplastic isoform X4 n=1 Tax=Magnolia sinica TaxID=86752 RepID=UPI0026594ED7|nr:phytochromobilin:ferredoxin oxidoreductase, chloroplastic isoform X4 [Magnolia sinica]